MVKSEGKAGPGIELISKRVWNIEICIVELIFLKVLFLLVVLLIVFFLLADQLLPNNFPNFLFELSPGQCTSLIKSIDDVESCGLLYAKFFHSINMYASL